MALADAALSTFLYYVLLPAAILFLLAHYVFGLQPKWRAFSYNFQGHWMHRKFFNREKKLLFAHMHDLRKKSQDGLSVLEIGVGSGMNFQFYPEGTRVTALDPNPHHEHYVKENLEKSGNHIKLVGFVTGFAEDMSSVGSDSFDAVVCTLTLCSVKDPAAALEEVKRVLKPGGTFFFLEHVAAKHGSFARHVQNIIQYIRPRHHSHGGKINRETWVFLDQSGLREVQYRHYSVNTWLFFFAKPCIYGTAVK